MSDAKAWGQFNLIGVLDSGYCLVAMLASFRGEVGRGEHTDQFLDDFFNAYDGCFFE